MPVVPYSTEGEVCRRQCASNSDVLGVVIPVGISLGFLNEGRDAYSTSAAEAARLLSLTNELQHQSCTLVSTHFGEVEQKHLD